MSLAACASETKKRAARAKLLSCQNPFASLPHSLLFLRNREKSAIVLVVVIIPFYAPRSIKRNNEKKMIIIIKDYTRFYVFVSQNKVDRRILNRYPKPSTPYSMYSKLYLHLQ